MPRKVRRIISCTTLNEFTREVVMHTLKHPDTKIEIPARVSEYKGSVWFDVVLNYERED